MKAHDAGVSYNPDWLQRLDFFGPMLYQFVVKAT